MLAENPDGVATVMEGLGNLISGGFQGGVWALTNYTDVLAAYPWPTVIVTFVAIYVGSLLLHPNRRCPACRKTPGKHWGWLFSYASRQCTTCDGSGRRPRWGTSVINTLRRRKSD